MGMVGAVPDTNTSLMTIGGASVDGFRPFRNQVEYQAQTVRPGLKTHSVSEMLCRGRIDLGDSNPFVSKMQRLPYFIGTNKCYLVVSTCYSQTG
jgi:hypothetical protein